LDAVRLSVICGPTGAGKTALALRLAEETQAGILSADSRQVYRGFDIGTASPTAAEQERIPHEGIDLIEGTERYSAARWMSSVDEWCAALAAKGRRVLVVGGTGLYLRTLSAPLFAEPPLDPEARTALARELDELPLDALRAQVVLLDPPRAHLGRTQLLRAIEVAHLTGRPISAWHAERARPARYDVRYLVVDPGEALHGWIARRVDAMLAMGWVDEVRALMDRLPPDAPAWNATGYDVIRQVALGTLSVARARDQILIATRQYAKRQRTWFRHQLPADRVLHVNSAAPDAYDRVRAWGLDEEGT
jgi:tRNA dimethylallyltransferase